MAERPLKSEARMTAAETLMWNAEHDPVLRSTFSNITFLDRIPDFDRFRARIARAVHAFPRLRQRVVEAAGGLGSPEWVDDPYFDLDHHVRHLAVPAPGTDRQFLDLAAVLAQDAFDNARPLWQLTIVDGLEGGRAAFIAKMHHTITDGVGGVRLSAEFIDLARDAPMDEAPEDDGDASSAPDDDTSLMTTVSRAAADTVRQVVGTGRAMAAVAGSIGNPVHAVDTARSLARQLVADTAHSPLWAGRRSMRRRFEVLHVDLEDAKLAAKRLGGTINDFYVAGIAGGAGAYHRHFGVEVDELRMSMPISTRTDRSMGGNAFIPTRVLVPVGILDPAERFEEVQRRLAVTKTERSIGFADSLAGVLTSLPTPLLVRMARHQVETVDFATSNVRGASFDLFVAGARILANHPMGPTAGTAFNATLMSYKGSLDIGLNIDAVAVTDPVLLCSCIETSMQELLAAGAT